MSMDASPHCPSCSGEGNTSYGPGHCLICTEAMRWVCDTLSIRDVGLVSEETPDGYVVHGILRRSDLEANIQWGGL